MISTNTPSKGSAAYTSTGPAAATSGNGRAASLSANTAAELGTQRMPFTGFVWGVGIECSFIPHLNVDQFNWTQHNRFWKDDLKRCKEELGVTHLRYAMPWHAMEPEKGKYDWAACDERLEEMQRLGLEPVMDVMHFGTPLWLKQAVGDPEFPEALERFTFEMVTRYAGAVKTWCPCNEPLVVSLFSGDFGFWPPHQRKWRGYMPILSRVSQAVSRGIRAVRQADPTANAILVDNVEHYKTRSPELQDEVDRRNLRRFLVMDLITGRVDKNHPLYDWVTDYGISEIDLEWFRTNPQAPDLMGLDYYPHSDWQLEMVNGGIRQRRADNPVGLYGIATQYYRRYGLPMMMTETSIEGAKINREIWFETMVEDARRLRAEGVPLLGLFWWPMVDNIDWDGALTHRVGKIHQVGLYNLERAADGTLNRVASPLVKLFKDTASRGDDAVGELTRVVTPGDVDADQTPLKRTAEEYKPGTNGNGHANGNGNGNGNSLLKSVIRKADPVAGASGEPAVGAEPLVANQAFIEGAVEDAKETDRYGIVVFSHLRWGFVWQRPQQFLSRFARKHRILFVEEPMFDVAEGGEPRVDYHRVMPNVVVACPHVPGSWNKNPQLPSRLREFTRQAIKEMNDDGTFDRPLLWYYSPMDSAWSLGHFENRGVVYDCMDELSQFTGAPRGLVLNESRLMRYADVVFTGGYNLGAKKKQQHDNVHIFGCGVEYEHFSQAQNPNTTVPPDIDFMGRPILGFFGVVDERVDYGMLGEVARLRPDWSIAMVGPVVKVDPNLLPHSPNLFWLGGRDYQVLPNYVKAFDVCMMPFALNAATEFINPTKGLEYMATGKPIIATHVKDVVRQWSDICYLTKNDPAEFVKVVEQILNNPDPTRIQRGTELAKQNSWENTVKTMQRLIKEAISTGDRKSKQKIEAITDPDQEVMAYQYQPTQGS